MREVEPRANLISTERALLRQLCRTGLSRIAPGMVEFLSRYSWVGPDHRIVFEALVRLSRLPPSSYRDRLPAETTRMGFPEINWEEFLAAASNRPCPGRTACELIEELISASKQGS